MASVCMWACASETRFPQISITLLFSGGCAAAWSQTWQDR